MLFKNRKGQNTAEYAILIGLVVAAAIAMQTYVKRTLQGRLKIVVDARPAVDTSPSRDVEVADPDKPGDTKTETRTATLPFVKPEKDGFFGKEHQYEPYYLVSRFGSEQGRVSRDQTVTGGAVLRDTREIGEGEDKEGGEKQSRLGYQKMLKPKEED